MLNAYYHTLDEKMDPSPNFTSKLAKSKLKNELSLKAVLFI